ncbi:heavy-metal-associated domain-containing protein [Methylomonas rivi]|uniref:Heavy-metal-associated domain-containing protein n=1 Tax=Methylomonas rivi TaxID=2952226 RepID=A0ABT1UAI6_9GAMM|nr:heavy-metal-associated domain-containing protein [Methylomonas sp. WSC-6]MCQ8130877.1 heavy-metal-associated domain-containing protein [Methylomonas sp. WSC-6]
MPTFEQLCGYLNKVRIAHHIRGRIRLRLEAYPKELPLPGRGDTEQLQSLVEQAAGVRSVRINLLARSCLIEYDPAVIPDQAWRDFIAGVSSAAALTLENILRDTYREISHAQL